MDARLQAFPSNDIKIVSVFQRLHGAKSGAQTLTFKSVTNRQTKNNLTFLAAPVAMKYDPHHLGMVLEDVEHLLAHRKLLEVWGSVA